MLADFGETLPSEVRTQLDTGLRETRTALAARDVALSTSRSAHLKRLMQEAGSTLYTQATQQGTSTTEPSPIVHLGAPQRGMPR